MQENRLATLFFLLISGTFLCGSVHGKTPVCAPKASSPCAAPKKINPTHPVSLKETLERAYMGSPELDASRAELRAKDEDVSIANADWRPSLSVNSEGVKQLQYPIQPSNTKKTQETRGQYTATLSQNIYKGGATVAAIGKAESDVSSGKAGLFVTEQNTLFQGVQTHTDVIAKEQIVKFQENNKKFTEAFLAQVEAQYEVGEKGWTDVEIARGEYEKALANLTASIGELEIAKAIYMQLTGVAPGPLSEGRVLVTVPDTYAEALCIAKKRNPLIIQNIYKVKAAEYTVDLQISELLPTLDVSGNVGNTWRNGLETFDPGVNSYRSMGGRVTLNVPVYLQGKPSAKVRQAYQLVAKAKVELVGAQRKVVRDTREAWENLLVARENVRSVLAQVKALEVSVEGAVEESNVGLKSVIDVLLQQQKLVDAQIRLADVQKKLVDANYQLFMAMGRMTACEMKLNVKTYDPDTYYMEYQKAWIQFWKGEDLRYVKDGETK